MGGLWLDGIYVATRYRRQLGGIPPGAEIGIAITLLAAAVGGMIRSVMIYATEALGDVLIFANWGSG